MSMKILHFFHRLVILSLALCALTSLSQAAIIVDWGNTGGADLVVGNQNFTGTRDSTYVPGTALNPAIGASYYSVNTNKNPYFFGQAYVASGTINTNAGKVWDSGTTSYLNGTGLSSGSAGSSYSFFLWKQAGNGSAYGFQNGMDSGNVTVNTFTLESSLNATTNVSASDFRFVLLQSGSYYISDAISHISTTLNPALLTNVAANSLNWHNWTVEGASGFANGGTVGSLVGGMTFDNIEGVGYWHNLATSASAGINVKSQYFSVDGTAAIPEPTTVALLLSGVAACAWRRKRSSTR